MYFLIKGNNGPAEFNMLVDPESASIVFQSGIDIYMVIKVKIL
jgi:inosine-uridine nucleoside N-ribohydrolase